MTSHTKQMRILHPTDFSKCAMKALELATELGTRLNAQVDVAHVVASDDLAGTFPDLNQNEEGLQSEVRQQLQATLREMHAERSRHLTERLAALCPPGGQPLILWGTPYTELQKHLAAYDLVVMGAHGANPFDHVVLGGLAGRLVRRSPVPVLTVRDNAEITSLERILVATDFSDAAKHAWDWTNTLVEAGVKRVATHVIDIPLLAQQTPYVQASTERLALFARGTCERQVLREGDPIHELPQIAKELGANAIVIGLTPHTVLGGWLLGGHADALLRSSSVPILSVPYPLKNLKPISVISNELGAPL